MSSGNETLDERMARHMKAILLANDGVCDVGGGGLRIDSLQPRLLRMFDAAEQRAVSNRLITMMNEFPFSFRRNAAGKDSVCLLQSSVPTPRAMTSGPAALSTTRGGPVATDRAQEILAEAIETGRAATKSDIVDTVHYKLDEKIFKKDIERVLDALTSMIAEHLSLPPNGAGQFVVPGLFIIEVKQQEGGTTPMVNIRPYKKLTDLLRSSESEPEIS